MAKIIENENQLVEAVKFIASETEKLSQSIVGKTFPISSLTIFSHTQEEYDNLIGILSGMGEPYNFNNGPRVKLLQPITVGTNKIVQLRVRQPESNRPQVGCNDFDTDYESFKKEYLEKYPANLNLIKRPEYEMIELKDSKFDVLAYVVSK